MTRHGSTKGESNMQDYTLDELEDYDNTSITIDDALWIGEDMYEQSEDLVDITYRITKGDFTHQIF
tara:strand:- start:313 stop:510 length:198 start_codon:yes stop_codon:yes gene_type:complete